MKVDYQHQIENIFSNSCVSIIAEIGINHNGSFDKAIQYIKSAAESGADAVKFQTFNPEKMYSIYTQSLMEKGDCSYKSRKEIDFFNKFVFSESQTADLKQYADECGVLFFSAPFDDGSVDMLERVSVPLYKIASSECTHKRLLEKIAKTKKPVIISTGMTDLEDVMRAIEILKNGCSKIAVLHCVSLYPVSYDKMNLSRINKIIEKTGCTAGFSDHSPDIDMALLSIGVGARIIEKHYMHDKNDDCPDSNVSIDREILKELKVKSDKYLIALGNCNADISADEKVIARGAKRSLFAADTIEIGEKITGDKIISLRPGIGISSDYIDDIIGKKAKIRIEKGMLLKQADFV